MLDAPAVFNIPAGYSFAEALAQGLLERAAENPLGLADYTILLPSRRACRTLREAFLRLSGGAALLLPEMYPVGEVDAEEVALRLAGQDGGAESLDFPAAVPKLERQILLAKLIRKAEMAQSFDQAMALAQELGRFLDEVETEGLSFDTLAGLVPEEFATHWQKTLDFLKILTEHWPGILATQGQIDQSRRRNLLLQAQVRMWEKHPPQNPVIAAGSTGTVPAAAELLALVARLPQGMLVLPGLDQGLDAASWEKIGEDHPQYNIKQLLVRMDVARADVRLWPVKKVFPVNAGRVRLLSEALRPAATTDLWRQLTATDIPAQALEGFTRIDCDTPQEEADLIALLMRETLETPGKTAALITPDRRLARRVALSLRRWGILIDDSGGQPLTELMIGTWLMLTAEAAAESFAPVTLLSFLKHPLMAAAMPPEELRGMTWLLDQVVLRGPRPAPGFAGLYTALEMLEERQSGSKARLKDWLERIEPPLREFSALMAQKKDVSFLSLLTLHVRVAETMATTTRDSGEVRLWQAEAGESASLLFGDLFRVAPSVPDLAPVHYVALLRLLLKAVTVRPRYGAHPRLAILGQIEARLFSGDRVILGGLNEGTWPALPAPDPWMSRPMRSKFGLPAPERSLSLAAHDFVQAASASEVFLTRARKVEGTPTVPARWLLRLETVMAAAGLDWPGAAAARYRKWVKDMDTPSAVQPVARPAPCPPVPARPRKLSVTKIESWMRDPYQIYAQYILKLKALDPLDADPGGAERGTFIHAALETFIKEFPDELPDDSVERLLVFGRQALLDMRIPPEVEAFWWPRFERIAEAFLVQERGWRGVAQPFRTEISGRLEIPAAGGAFALTGKADRIDRLRAGGYAVIDYKTGAIPGNSDVREGLSPQLPLEALMIERGAFPDIPAGPADTLVYWHMTGSGRVPVERREVLPRGTTVQNMVAEAEAGIRALVDKFDDPATPYLSQPRTDAKPRFSDYEHLARVREWGISGDTGEGAE